VHAHGKNSLTDKKPERRNIMAKVQKSTDSSSLAEVVDRILDKGIVIDAWAKVSLVGIELLSIEARVVIASVETYLKYAEAIGLTASAAAPA
jgi:gas vesicle structural protein